EDLRSSAPGGWRPGPQGRARSPRRALRESASGRRGPFPLRSFDRHVLLSVGDHHAGSLFPRGGGWFAGRRRLGRADEDRRHRLMFAGAVAVLLVAVAERLLHDLQGLEKVLLAAPLCALLENLLQAGDDVIHPHVLDCDRLRLAGLWVLDLADLGLAERAQDYGLGDARVAIGAAVHAAVGAGHASL